MSSSTVETDEAHREAVAHIVVDNDHVDAPRILRWTMPEADVRTVKPIKQSGMER